jgi:hypothetical protein
MDVLAASRRGSNGLRLDVHSTDFEARLRAAGPSIVIHCVGPFQGQDYRVANAALAAGAHYVDLSDGRDFVVGFADQMDRMARAARRIAVSGASTLPALSSAVVDFLAPRLRELTEISISIAPGQRAPRGEATVAAVLSYAGRRFKWLKDGIWRDAWGWHELKRLRFAELGTRWAAACDVPDLELFPARYPRVRTVEFRAALEVSLQHFGLWAVAALRRMSLPIPMEKWAKPLNGIAAWMDGLGSDRGGMLVSVGGISHDGSRARIEWHLTAQANHGPEIPCMAAILLARKLARGEIAGSGAFPCMGFLKLADFEPEFARWKIVTTTTERPE